MVLILCGVGLPFPEEVILVAAGYTSYLGKADAYELIGVCAAAILVGDSIPFVLGRIFGPKLLRLRIVRSWISTKRLAHFDNWFQRHGRLTIFVARFLTGIRVPAFFAAGSMRMSVTRFLVMDGLGVMICVPLFIGLGHFGGEKIDVVRDWVVGVERGILILIGVGGVVAVGVYFWYRRRRSRKLLGTEITETFVGPPAEATPATPGAPESPDEDSAPAPPDPPEPVPEPGESSPASTVEPPEGHR